MEKHGGSSTYKTLLKNWYLLVIFNIFVLIIFLGYCYHPVEVSEHMYQQSDNASNYNTSNLPFKLNQEQMETYLTLVQDNEEYFVEYIMMRLFPTRASDIIQDLVHCRSRFYLFRPFWSWWYKRKAWKQQITSLEFPPPEPSQSSTTAGTQTCGSPESLPLPLLRYIVTTNLELSTPSIFDYPKKIKKPFVYVTQANIHLCVTVIIPEDPPDTGIVGYNSEYIYHPLREQLRRITSPWWDSIIVSAWNMDTDGAIPIHMEPWQGHKQLRDEWIRYIGDKPHFMLELESMMHERKTMHIYQGSVMLRDPGRYKLDAKLDYQEGKWNFELGPIVPYSVQEITDIYPPGPFDVQEKQLQKYHHHHQHSDNRNANIDDSTLESVVKDHMALPLCTRMDLPGRWLPSYVLPAGEEPPGLGLAAKFWAPYSCRLRQINYNDFGACLANKYPAGIDTVGDSNTRRMIKKIVTHGRWCADWNSVSKEYMRKTIKMDIQAQQQQQQEGTIESETNIHQQNITNPLNWEYTGEQNQLRACYCEDYGEPGWNKEWFDANSRKQLIWVGNRTTGAYLRSHKWDGLTYLNNPSWEMEMEYHPNGDIAIFSIGNWDSAFLTLEQFQEELDLLVDLVAQRYQHYKYVIYRTPQYYCCRADRSPRYRHISGQRVQLFNQVAKRTFRAKVKNLIIWDTYLMGESRTWKEKQLSRTCSSNHVSADVVEVENQILMNALCNV